jgi:hypothetical protein
VCLGHKNNSHISAFWGGSDETNKAVHKSRIIRIDQNFMASRRFRSLGGISYPGASQLVADKWFAS